MALDEERIAIYLDYENLAIGAREDLGGLRFDFKPIADALAEMGRVVVRRAYADWNSFADDRRMLAHHHVELLEIPQRMGAARKNAADIKMAVDAMELAFERDYITTIVVCTGDSDFTPLVQKLRELDKRVIGVGLKASTSNLLPPACDEFLFYENLEGVEVPTRKRRRRGGSRRDRDTNRERADEDEEVEVSDGDLQDLAKLLTGTLAGLQRTSSGAVRSSTLKRAIRRKDPAFTEADYGFRAWGELLRHLQKRHIVTLEGGAQSGDPEVDFADSPEEQDAAFSLLVEVVREEEEQDGPPPLSGLKDRLRSRQRDFSEKELGYRGFLQFCKAARTEGLIEMDWDDESEDYLLRAMD